MFKYLKNKFPLPAFLLIPCLLLLVSCGPERMIGSYYVKNSAKGSILLIRPGFIYKNNHMRLDLSDQMSEAEKDSVSFYRSSYLQYISDSAFIEDYMNSFIDRLLSAGFDVYAQESRDSFKLAGPPAYIINVAQLQMEESRDTTGSESLSGMEGEGSNYPSGLSLNTLRLSSWFEFTELNPDSANVKKLFFASSVARDAVKSGLNLMPESGEPGFQLHIDTLTMNDVYDLARQSGRKYGDYLVDYLMNEFIRLQMPNDMVPQLYMHYDPELRRVRNSNGEGFQELEPGK